MSERPVVSVVTIFRDAERFLRDAVDSVLAQTYGDWELLLVDDGSVDRGTEIARAMAGRHPRRIRYLQHPEHENRGISASRNLGIAEARGEWIAMLDADDVWVASKLAEQLAIAAREPRAALIYGTRMLWRSWDEPAAEDPVVGHGIAADRLYVPPSLFVLTFGLRQATVPSCSDMMFRRSAALRAGGFEDSFRGMYDDQAFLVKLHLTAPTWVSNRCWTRYRQHPDSCVARWSASPRPDRDLDSFTRWMNRYVAEWSGDDPEVASTARRALRARRPPLISRMLAGLLRRTHRSGAGA